jgi:predicted RNase H-like nuclease
MRFVGVDLAWQSDKNPSAIGIASLKNNCLHIESLHPNVFGLIEIQNLILATTNVVGVAIDAPLIINNEIGQRLCERELSRVYGARKASCHTANKSLYPNAMSVSLAENLKRYGFNHCEGEKWQIECYPHPAIIECFGLSERLLYKKGKVAIKREGQAKLGMLIQKLEQSAVLQLKVPVNLSHHLNYEYIFSLKGQALKSNEDALDAIICAYIAALKYKGVTSSLFGTVENGYIWVPTIYCVNE